MESSTTKNCEVKSRAAKRKYHKLSAKLVSCCILLALLITASSCMIGYWKYRDSTFEIYNSFAYKVANTASSYVDGARIADYLVTGEKDEAYEEMAQHLYTLYKNTEVRSIYICVPNAEDVTIANIYDVRIHETEYPEYYELGVVDPIGANNPELIIGIYQTGELSEDYFIRETDYGYNTSAVVPLIGSDGTPSAILVVDVPMALIDQALREYLIFSVSVSVIVVVLFVAFFVMYLKKGIVSPLRLIAKEAAEFIEEETSVSGELQNVRTGDEIEMLATSIHQMEIDINQYIDNLTTVTAEKERIGAELNVATQIQASMLPAVYPWPFPDREDFDIHALMTPAKEVGGDFYDFFFIDDDHLALVIGDVSGKGVPASLFMVIAKTLIKDRALAGATPAEIFTTTNNQLCEGNGGGLFVTGWMGIYEFSTRKFTYVNAGHNPPLIRRADGQFEYVKSRAGLVLAGMEGIRYRQTETELNPGDTLYIYTDGVTEATNSRNELFGNDRLQNVLNANIGATAENLLKAVLEDIDRFVQDAPQFDDITMLGFTVKK